MTRTTRTPTRLVDDLARLAGGADPAPLDESGMRRLVERALVRDVAARSPRRVPWRGLAVAAAAAAVLAWFFLRPVPPAPLLALSLPTGDRVVGVAGADFQIERIEPEHRRIRMRGGTLLFEVAQAAPHQQFAVVTPDLVATARGTVFSVSITSHGSHVAVYEGSVEIVQAAITHTLVAGDAWDSRRGAVPAQPPSALVASVEDAVARRSAAADVRPSPSPSPSPPPSLSPSPSPSPSPPPSPSAPPSPSPSPPPSPSPSPSPRSPDLPAARAALSAGNYALALSLATAATSAPHRAPASPAWLLILGDAHRGLDHAAAAADAYDAAARALAPALDSIEPAYTAAYLRFTKLSDPDGALASLVPATYAESSPLEERALALRAQILSSLHRTDDASSAAARYLERFPHVDLRATMLRLRTTAAP
jgi:hypothetical protein